MFYLWYAQGLIAPALFQALQETATLDPPRNQFELNPRNRVIPADRQRVCLKRNVCGQFNQQKN